MSGIPSLQILGAGETEPSSETALPAPPGAVVSGGINFYFWFGVAPDGRVAVFYETETVTGTPNWQLTAVALAEDGGIASDPVVLSDDGSINLRAVFFDDGGYGFADADGLVVRTDADGRVISPSTTVLEVASGSERLVALSDDRLLIWRPARSAEAEQLIYILDADGSALAQVTAPTRFESGNPPEFLSFEDGGIGTVWSTRSSGVQFSALTEDGSFGPVETLLTPSGLPNSTEVQLQKSAVFDDGTFGLIYSAIAPDGFRYYFQRFSSDGGALSDPAILFEDVPGEILNIAWAFELIPAGGAIFLFQEVDDTLGFPVKMQVFDINGTAAGAAQTILTETRFQENGDYTFLVGGTGVALSWETRSSPGDPILSTLFLEAVEFRNLTPGDDVETLTEPESVAGLDGDDQITGSDGADQLVGGAGDDTLDGAAGNDVLTGGVGNNLLNGGAGLDTAVFGQAFSAFEIDLDAATGDVFVIGTGSMDRVSDVELFQFSDAIFSAEDVLLESGVFDDVVNGTSNADVYETGIGDDLINGLSGDDTLDAGDGNDRIIGGDGNDLLIGGPDRQDGNDRIFGGLGDDMIQGGDGNDALFGQQGGDRINGGFGVDEVFGQSGNDVLTGGASSDAIFGADGGDFLNGGFGNDRLNGGGGADIFYHLGQVGHGTDWIQDFSNEDGDLLFFGDDTAEFGDFRLQFAHAGRAAGSEEVAEAFVSYVPTGQIVWALIDGAAQDEIRLKLNGHESGVFDLIDLV